MFEAMTLYGYWRSSAAYRIRIAFGLKKIAWVDAPVNLLTSEQKDDAYMKINPMGVVPALKLNDGTILTQSLAILDWLETKEPDPPLWPEDPIARAKVTAAGHTIAVDTHPIQNSGVVNHLKAEYALRQDQGVDWMINWMERGFTAFQELCDQDTPFAFGNQPSFADVCLIPQLYNARRWKMNLRPYSRLTETEFTCMRLSAFREAAPENQPDAD